MSEIIIKRIPFGIVKVKSKVIDHHFETILTSSRDDFVSEKLLEKELKYDTAFKETFKRLDETGGITDIFYQSAQSDLDIELRISFRYKNFFLPVESTKEKEPKDFPEIEESKKEDKIKTLTFKNKIHGQVYLTGDKINEEYELAIIGMEHSSSEDRKKNFITQTTRAASEQYRKTFFQEFKTVNRYDEIVSVMYKTEKGDMQLLIRFEKKDVEVRVLYTDSGMEVLDADNILLLEKELKH